LWRLGFRRSWQRSSFRSFSRLQASVCALSRTSRGLLADCRAIRSDHRAWQRLDLGRCIRISLPVPPSHAKCSRGEGPGQVSMRVLFCRLVLEGVLGPSVMAGTYQSSRLQRRHTQESAHPAAGTDPRIQPAQSPIRLSGEQTSTASRVTT